jgi:excisionase family DNA binding protein
MDEAGYQPPPGYITLTEARRRLGVSKTTMAKKVRQGLLPTYQDPRDGRVRLAKIEDVTRLAEPIPVPPRGQTSENAERKTDG